MKAMSRLRYLIYFSILIFACTTGKKALQKGNYDQSVFKSVDRLKSAPKSEEARYVLPIAFDLALKEHLRKIDEAKLSADVLRWETVLAHYQKINQLSDEVASSPVALSLIKNPPKYVNEVEDSQYKAAEVRYALGVNAMKINNRQSARQAYYDFEKAANFYPNYKDVNDKMEKAYWNAVVKVLVKPAIINSNMYQLSNQYFQEQVNLYLAEYRQNMFVRFYTAQQADQQKIQADQLLQLDFDDFVVGQTYVNERVEKLVRDSVVIGETRARAKIYGTVSATYRTFAKTISSSGLLNYAIVDLNTKKIIRNQKLVGTYIWEDFWASYNGDDRALTNQQLALARRREMLPPPPASLFVEFTKPIYSQLVGEINNFYAKY